MNRNPYLPSEQSKSPVSEAHSVPLLQLYLDLNMSGLTWWTIQNNRKWEKSVRKSANASNHTCASSTLSTLHFWLEHFSMANKAMQTKEKCNPYLGASSGRNTCAIFQLNVSTIASWCCMNLRTKAARLCETPFSTWHPGTCMKTSNKKK